MSTIWTLHWVSNSDMLVSLYFFATKRSIIEYLIKVTIDSSDELKLGKNKGIEICALFSENYYKLLI